MMGKNEKMELVLKCKVCNQVEVGPLPTPPPAPPLEARRGARSSPNIGTG